jgi:DNA-directed RNA polymerase specialized sigma24 family protein
LVTALRPNHRRVIVLHYLADLPVGDIAIELGRLCVITKAC